MYTAQHGSATVAEKAAAACKHAATTAAAATEGTAPQAADSRRHTNQLVVNQFVVVRAGQHTRIPGRQRRLEWNLRYDNKYE